MASQTQTATAQVENLSIETKDATEKLLSDLESQNTKPLWAQMAKLNPPLPNPKTVPHLWEYEKIRPHLLRAGELITEKQAERRVAMLINPARDAPYTTDTLYAGLQLVMPNETAPAHRHTAFAMRFIIEGTGGFTAVHGRRINMTRGDVILTPTWNWHDHGKDGSGPMIWLDGLDLPSFVHFPVHFVEHYQQPRYPAENVDTSASPIVFPWAKMKAALDEEKGGWASRRYLRRDGSEVSKSLGGCAERLNAGQSSPVAQETASSVYHIIEGSGHSIIDNQKISWRKGDTFCVPSWYKYQHFADAGETVYLYRFDDKPMLMALGFYRTSETDLEALATPH
ncbi:RmlC-like cupin domain-containing protein [Xylogone sp. PMI_703]|nr:RmlC-like cupin domain-containing protein [Xylogone sp. PMI_703]